MINHWERAISCLAAFQFAPDQFLQHLQLPPLLGRQLLRLLRTRRRRGNSASNSDGCIVLLVDSHEVVDNLGGCFGLWAWLD